MEVVHYEPHVRSPQPELFLTRVEFTGLYIQRKCGTLKAAEYLVRVGYGLAEALQLLCVRRISL